MGSEPGKGRFSGEHARAGMMMKRKREKFDRGFRFDLVSVLPGEEASGVGSGGRCAGREKRESVFINEPGGFQG